jgi:hypothetical protein
MVTFQINAVIQFLTSSTYFESHVFIFRQTVCTCKLIQHVFYIEAYIASYRNFIMEYITYKTARTNDLPDDENNMFETCRRPQELN